MNPDDRLKAILDVQAKSKAAADAKIKAAKEAADTARIQREIAIAHWEPVQEAFTQWIGGLNDKMRENGRQIFVSKGDSSGSRVATLNIAYKRLMPENANKITQRLQVNIESNGGLSAAMGSASRWVEKNYNFQPQSYVAEDLIAMVLDFLEHNPEIKQ